MLVDVDAKNRFFVARMLFSSILDDSLSMNSCGFLQMAMMPNPVGIPFSGNITSNTNGYRPCV